MKLVILRKNLKAETRVRCGPLRTSLQTGRNLWVDRCLTTSLPPLPRFFPHTIFAERMKRNERWVNQREGEESRQWASGLGGWRNESYFGNLGSQEWAEAYPTDSMLRSWGTRRNRLHCHCRDPLADHKTSDDIFTNYVPSSTSQKKKLP